MLTPCEFGVCGAGFQSGSTQQYSDSVDRFLHIRVGIPGTRAVQRATTYLSAHKAGIINALIEAYSCAVAPDSVTDIRALQQGHLYGPPRDDDTLGGGPGPLYTKDGPEFATEPMGSVRGAVGMNGAAAALDYANSVKGCANAF